VAFGNLGAFSSAARCCKQLQRIPQMSGLIITMPVDVNFFSRGPGEKQKKWKHPPLMNAIYSSASTWTTAFGVLHLILGTNHGTIQIEARAMEDQGALHTRE
jgi:hypothetical protein